MNVERRHWWHRRPHLYPRPPWRLRAWFRFRALVRSERAWRLIGMLAFAGSSCLSAYTLINTEHQRCGQRTDSRADIRAGIEAAADEVAAYARVPPDGRAELNERVAARVATKVGPPDC